MRLIGISGKKQTGKSTFATALQIAFINSTNQTSIDGNNFEELQLEYALKGDWSNKSEWTRKAFANKLKKVIHLIVGQFPKGDLKNRRLPPVWQDITYREALQIIGTDLLRDQFNEKVWVNALFANFYKDSKWIVTDVRFQNEAAKILSEGGILIRMERNTELQDNHPSELDMDSWKHFDYVVDNNQGFLHLYEQAMAIVKQIKQAK